MGPTGATGATGTISEFGYFYATGSTAIASDTPVVLTASGPTLGGITFTAPSTDVAITEDGTYLILYTLLTTGSTNPAVFGIQVNSVTQPSTIYGQNINTATDVQSLYGNAILSITAPATIRLVNIGNTVASLQDTLDGEILVNAAITVIRLA